MTTRSDTFTEISKLCKPDTPGCIVNYFVFLVSNHGYSIRCLVEAYGWRRYLIMDRVYAAIGRQEEVFSSIDNNEDNQRYIPPEIIEDLKKCLNV